MSKRNIFITAFVAVGLLTSLGHAAIAQSPSPTSPSPGVTPSSTTPGVTPTTSPSPGVTPSSTTPGVTPTASPSPGVTPSPTTSPRREGTQSRLSPADREFMVEAARGGMAEVQFAQIALKRASSSTVKQYAQRMIQEHTKANNELMTVAKAKGVTLPKSIGTKHEALKKRLSALSGKSFDREYMQEAGVKSHQEQASLFERQLESGQDPDVKEFATRTLPVVQEHLQQAQKFTASSGAKNRVR